MFRCYRYAICCDLHVMQRSSVKNRTNIDERFVNFFYKSINFCFEDVCHFWDEQRVINNLLIYNISNDFSSYPSCFKKRAVCLYHYFIYLLTIFWCWQKLSQRRLNSQMRDLFTLFWEGFLGVHFLKNYPHCLKSIRIMLEILYVNTHIYM